MNFRKGFTLIELLVVVAIIGVLATVVLAVLGSAKGKSSDSKIVSQVGQMNSQAFLFGGTMGTAAIIGTAPFPGTPPATSAPGIPYLASYGIVGSIAGGTPASGTLFNDTTFANNSLWQLASKLPSTYIYYGWDGVNPNTTGRWFFAAATSTGAFCNDYKSEKKSVTGTPPTNTVASFTAYYPNATAAGGYVCN